MPHLCLLFDDVVEASLRGVANQIAAGSAFVQQQDPFHVAFLGSLHTYSTEQINAGVAAAPPVRGRWVAWELHQKQLRVAVELELDGAAACLSLVKAALPLGKPWRTHYVVIGSAANIDSAVHDDFLAAVEQAFPIDASQFFTTSQLSLHNTGTKAAAAAADALPPPRPKLNPKARSFVPCSSRPRVVMQDQRRIIQKKHKRPSPHVKWQRAKDGANAKAGASSMDVLIRSTGAAGRHPKPERSVGSMRQ